MRGKACLPNASNHLGWKRSFHSFNTYLSIVIIALIDSSRHRGGDARGGRLPGSCGAGAQAGAYGRQEDLHPPHGQAQPRQAGQLPRDRHICAHRRCSGEWRVECLSPHFLACSKVLARKTYKGILIQPSSCKCLNAPLCRTFFKLYQSSCNMNHTDLSLSPLHVTGTSRQILCFVKPHI